MKKKEEPTSGMKSVQGKCKYCGQYMALEVPESFSETDIEDEATKRCDCVDAVSATQAREKTANGEGAVKDIFKDREELNEVKEIFLKKVESIVKYKIDNISVTKGRYKCKMKRSKDGVKVEIEEKTVDSIES